MTVFELGEDIIVVDARRAFPPDEHHAGALVRPDSGYLQERPTGTRTTLAASRTSCGR